MSTRTKTGLEILQAAALMGVLGNLLLRVPPWGLSAFLFVTAFVAALLMLMKRRRPELLTKTTIALTGAMVFFSSMYLFRASSELLVFDTFAIIGLMGVIILVNFDVKAHIAGAFHYVAGIVWAGITSVFGSIALLAVDIDWNAMPGNNWSRHIFSALRGIAIALPLILIFGGLFMAADAAFEGLVNNAFNFNIETVVSHVVLTSLFAWLTAGYFRGVITRFPVDLAATADSVDAETKSSESGTSFVDKVAAEPADTSASLPDNATILEHINRSDPPNMVTANTDKKVDWQNFDNSKIPPAFTLGTVETVIILGLVDLLFLAFVTIQVPYLFGGMDLVQTTPDFKLADYARRGFGELVTVATLVLPMLLSSHWLLRRESGKTENIFKVLAGVQIGLLFVIMASAAQRLLLLTGELGYGMTTVRFYPMVFMIWLAVVFAWFALTVLRGGRNYFAWGALWSAVVILGATNLMNPDAFIARTNINLMQQGRDFDVLYNSNLSDDAIPILFDGLPSMNPHDQCRVAFRLYHRSLESDMERDLRSWNLSRSTARGLMAEYLPPVAKEVTMDGCPNTDLPAPF